MNYAFRFVPDVMHASDGQVSTDSQRISAAANWHRKKIAPHQIGNASNWHRINLAPYRNSTVSNWHRDKTRALDDIEVVEAAGHVPILCFFAVQLDLQAQFVHGVSVAYRVFVTDLARFI